MTDIEYKPTTSWEPGELAADEQNYAAFRDGFAMLVAATVAAVETGRPHAVIAHDVAQSLQWMNPYQALTMLATMAVEAATEIERKARP